MEWGIKENRIAVIALHKCGKSANEIFKLLKPLKITQRFVFRAIRRFDETQSFCDRERSGRPRDIRTPAAIKAVESRIRRNPLRKQQIMAREMSISTRSMSRIIKSDLGMGAFRRSTGHLLTSQLKSIRTTRSKALLQRYDNNKHRQILFTDEKIFTVEEKFNRQNDRIYAHSSREAREVASRVQRGHHPASVMVWWGVSYEGVTQLHFCEKGVKTAAKNYQADVLEGCVKPLSSTLFGNRHWVFQQDSAPAHKARTTQAWLETNVPEFIKASDWPSGSPDLNPLDYKLWAELEQMVCRKRHPNIDSLKRALKQAVANFPQEIVRTAIDDWPNRLRCCVNAKGAHFE